MTHFGGKFGSKGGLGFAKQANEPVKPSELTDEIREIRRKSKEFQATNDHQTYLVVVFSSKEDKHEFLEAVDIDAHTFVDGYQLSERIGKGPKKPLYNLAAPLRKK